jgi:hypothetical protein
MSGHKSFQGLIKDFSPERIERIDQKKQALAQLELSELLKAAAPGWDTQVTGLSIEAQFSSEATTQVSPRFLIIRTDRNSGCKSAEECNYSSASDAIKQTLSAHTTQDIDNWLEDGDIKDLRDFISKENGVEISILQLPDYEIIL